MRPPSRTGFSEKTGPGRAELLLHGQSECSGAGYISADLLETNLHEIHLQTGGGPYIRYTQPLAAWLEVDAHAENVVAQMTGHLGPRYRRGIVEGLHVKIFRPQGDIGGD